MNSQSFLWVLSLDQLKLSIEGGMSEVSDEGKIDKQRRQCGKMLKIAPKKCDVKTINWTGKVFAVAVKEQADIEIEKKIDL